MKRTVRSMRFKSFDEFAREYPALGALLCRDDHEFLDIMRRRITDGLHMSQGQIDAMRKFLPPGEGGPPPVGQLVSVRARLPGTRKVNRGRAYYHWECVARGWAGLLDIVSPARADELEDAFEAVPGWEGPVRISGRVVGRRRTDSGWYLVIRGAWLSVADNAKREPACPDKEPPEAVVSEPGIAELAKCEGDDDWLNAMKN